MHSAAHYFIRQHGLERVLPAHATKGGRKICAVYDARCVLCLSGWDHYLLFFQSLGTLAELGLP